MKTLLFAISILFLSSAYALDLPAGSTLVYRGPQDSAHDYAYFHGGDSYYWRWLVRKHDDSKVSDTKYTGLSAFRVVLLTITDQIGIMNNPLWQTDSDGDGYSDMLEYLTNGDPYSAATVPTESRVLTFDNGQTHVPLLAAKDIVAANPDEIPANADTAPLVAALDRIAIYLHLCLILGAFMCGLLLWRLVILAKSQRNLF